MKILNEEHFENVKRYAESIGDTSLQKCLERLKSWEENPDCPSEISLYYDHAPYSFGFTQHLSLIHICKAFKTLFEEYPELVRSSYEHELRGQPWKAYCAICKKYEELAQSKCNEIDARFRQLTGIV